MAMFLVQGFLWLLIAFLLGVVVGRLLKSMVCSEGYDQDVYGMNKAAMSARNGGTQPG